MLLVSTCSSAIGGTPIIPAGAGAATLKGTSGSSNILRPLSTAIAALHKSTVFLAVSNLPPASYTRAKRFYLRNASVCLHHMLCRIDLQQVINF